MSTTVEAISSGDHSALTLYRITRAQYANLFPPPTSRGRFDDPRSEYRVLYVTLERAASFAESLQQFRPDLAARAALAGLTANPLPRAEVRMRSWTQGRVLLTMRLARNSRLCDLRRSPDLERAADGIAREALALGIADFDVSQVTGHDRRVTQHVSRWAFDAGYDGLLFPSRFGTAWTCCALFNRIRPRVVGREAIKVTDVDLLEVSRAFGIRVV